MTQLVPTPTRTSPSRARPDLLAAAAVVITVLLWGSAFVGIRAVGHGLSPAPLALTRVAVAALTLTVVVLAGRRRTRLRRPTGGAVTRATALRIAVYGVLWLAGYTVALNAAEQHVDAGTASLLISLAPMLIAVGSVALLGERFRPALVVGSAVALSGVALIASGSTGTRDLLGIGLCLLAAGLFAIGALVQKVVLREVDGLVATWLGCIAAVGSLLPWVPQLIAELQVASVGVILGGVYLGLFPTAIGFTTWAYALRRMDAGRLSATTYAVPPVSILLSWVLLAEVPTPRGIAGGVICLLGVAVSRGSLRLVRQRRRRAA